MGPIEPLIIGAGDDDPCLFVYWGQDWPWLSGN